MQNQEMNAPSTGANLIIVETGRVISGGLDEKQSWLLGRTDPSREDRMPDLPLRSRLVSREHGYFQRLGNYWAYVENPKNLNGTFHNGRKMPKHPRGLRQPVMLTSGDTLRIDNDQFCHSDSVLILFTTENFGDAWAPYSLNGRETTIIGSSKTCDLPQPNTSLSERHAKITALNGEFYLSDCGSETGTYRNGEIVTGPVILREKDIIRLGDRIYFFVQSDLIYSV